MKKTKVIILLAVCLTVVMSFVGCGKPYSNYDLSEYIKVADYKGLEVKSFKVNVTAKEVNQEIESRLSAAASTKNVKTGTVKNGDTIVITYEGKVDGKTFDGGSAEGASLTIGSGQFIDGFESGLVGVKVGKTKTLNLTFPDNYATNEELEGKDVVFTVTVDAKQKKVTPKLDETFIKDNSTKSKTVAEYKKEVKKDLEKKEKSEGVATQKEYLWNSVMEKSEVKKDSDGKEKYPEDEINRVVEEMTDKYKSAAKENDLEFSDYLEQKLGMDEKTFKKQVKEYAKYTVKKEEILYYIADKEKIEVTNDEYDKYLEKVLKETGYTEETFKEAMGQSVEEYLGKENIKTQLYLDKVQNLMLDKAKVVDKLSTK